MQDSKNTESKTELQNIESNHTKDSKNHNIESNSKDSKNTNHETHKSQQDSKLQNIESNSDKNSKDSNKHHENTPQVWVKGRVKFIRLMGKASFIKIEDSTALLQVYFSQNELGELFKILKKTLEVGDIVNVHGFPFVTKTGELSIHALDFKILTKAIVPLPEKFHGLQDIETRYRQRYLDLIVNSDVKRTFITRSKIVSLVRQFFEARGFLEVETPMLHPIPGGANARPFITHHNALDVERYLRIAPELYLKRLIVGGFEAVFEINRNFRNEGIDHSHNPEFSMIEFYWAYHTFYDLIDLTRELFAFLLDSLKLGKVIPFDDKSINFDNFQVMTYKDSIIKIGCVESSIVESKEKLECFLRENGLKLPNALSHDKLLNEAFDNFVENKLIDPTFIIDYPIEISPLARRSDADSKIADRFELFIGGKEIANGFSELNDPLDQLERFKAQVAQKDKGDEEAQYMDEDYVWALAHGMPPTAGQGIGIDRLVMLLTNNKSIKDVILFPAMKPLES
ncbi:lysine--tRNA ligase [Helicobacter saguini]|uniref:Lysine--tRNA ligase n=2 Tax=Helicobacter saguini TaxID=1548018 RepID=A0A347W6Z7_9HELI|nr:lysine--tRNA ligase [Helicobacter saguini]MWV66660.1 lysine--tRNA ligase [Helicobacter saguini]MWV69010.1 lysine--tRNA ligase [Helicobacter saguini]MWV71436.1 lysine--tRNA ligase [Helicobacter saguini]TLD94131.1 lysine--tRNA ligase [Helicobacter saguini]